MTDSAVDQSEKRDNDQESPPSPQNSVQLQFPQLLLEASLHSLLHHSYSSGSASTVIDMTRLGQSLSESWASFSDADFSQEDDMRSETTDAGSLIDVNSTQDVHSVNEHGESSDGEESKYSPLRPTARGAEDGSQSEEEYDIVLKRSLSPTDPLRQFGHSTSNMMRLQQSTPKSETTENESESIAELSQHNYATEQPRLADREDHVVGSIINMAVADRRLDLGQRPFRILYVGSDAVLPDTKVEVLRKIGAVLVAGASSLVDSACYHVVPSDFGPGSTPDTTELIPVPTQMVLHECKLPIHPHTQENGKVFDFELIDGSSLRGNAEKLELQGADEHWYQPDLLLLLTSEDDTAQHRQAAGDMLSLARTYFLPKLVLRQESGWDSSYYLQLDADNLHEKVMVDSTDPNCSLRIAVGVNDFAALDSEQLNRHFKFIIGSELEASRRRGPAADKREGKDTSRWSASLRLDDHHNQKHVRGIKSHLLPDKQNYASTKSYQWIRTCIVSTIWVLVLAFVSSRAYEQAVLMTGYGARQAGDGTNYAPGSLSAPSDSVNEMNKVPDPMSTRSTELSLISEKLREVAEYLPLHKVTENFVKDRPAKGRLTAHNDPTNSCSHSVSERASYPGESFAVSNSFFKAGKPNFDVAVTRDGHPVSYILEEVETRVSVIKIPLSDLHGRLNIILKSRGKQSSIARTEVNLKGSSIERLAKRAHSATKDGASAWILVRVHTRDVGLRAGLDHMTQYALKTIGAAQASIEDRITEQALACRQQSDKCWTQKAQRLQGRISTAVQQYEQSIVGTGQQAQEQARALTNGLVDTVSNALDTLRDLVPSTVRVSSKMRRSGERMSWKAARKVAKAQKRAKRLVSRRCGRSWRKSRC